MASRSPKESPTPRASRVGVGLPSRRPSDIASPSRAPSSSKLPLPGGSAGGGSTSGTAMMRRVSHDSAIRVIPRRTSAAEPSFGPGASRDGNANGTTGGLAAGGTVNGIGNGSISRPFIRRASSKTPDSSRPTSPLSLSGGAGGAGSGIGGTTTPPRVRPTRSALQRSESSAPGSTNNSTANSRFGSSRTSFHMSDSSISEAGEMVGPSTSTSPRASLVGEGGYGLGQGSAQGYVNGLGNGHGSSTGIGIGNAPGHGNYRLRRKSSNASIGSQDSIGRSLEVRRTRRISSGGLEGPRSRRVSGGAAAVAPGERERDGGNRMSRDMSAVELGRPIGMSHGFTGWCL